MVIQSTAYEPRERLVLISRALQELHRELLEYQRREYERSFGRIGSDFYVLQLAAEDPQFAWLRALSQEMIRIDVAISGKETPDEDVVRLAGNRLRYLVVANADGNAFQSQYDRAMQTNPGIVMAHVKLMQVLPPVRRVTLFRSEPTTDIRTRDDVPGVEERFHHPGEMVPGHGDHGYRVLATIVETVLPPGAGIPMHRHANEDIVSWMPEGIVRNEHGQSEVADVSAANLLVVNAGTGIDHAVTSPESDAPLRLIEAYVRPKALNGDPRVQHGPVPASASGKWRLLAGPEDGEAPFSVRNAIEISDAVIAAGDSVELPAREGWDTVFFVYDGEVEVDDVTFGPSQSGLVIAPERVTVMARETARVLAFMVDPKAKVTRAGTVGR